MQIIEDEENQLESALFKLLDIADDEEEDDELEDVEEKTEQERESRMGSIEEAASMEGDIEKSQQEEQVV